MAKRLSEMTDEERGALSMQELAALTRAAAVEVLGEAKVAELLAAAAATPSAPVAPSAVEDSRREAMRAGHATRAGYWPACAGAPPSRSRRRRRGVA